MNKTSGQIAIFVLLVMLLGLTIGLSITSRTIQDLKQSNVSDQSSRAFTAAEAGVEQALSTTLANGQTGTLNINNVNVKYTVSQTSGTAYSPSQPVAKDDVVGIDLSAYTGSTITVYWNKSSDYSSTNCTSTGFPASLELTYYVQSGGNYKTIKYAYNDHNCSGTLGGSNNFSAGQPVISGPSGFSSTTGALPFPGGTKVLLRIRPIYNNASIEVMGNATLPAQSYTITSTAQTTGGATRAVQVTKTIGTLPPIFDYVLFSGQNLSQ